MLLTILLFDIILYSSPLRIYEAAQSISINSTLRLKLKFKCGQALWCLLLMNNELSRNIQKGGDWIQLESLLRLMLYFDQYRR